MRAKLSDRQKLAIYNQHCFGERIEDLAESYEVSTATIYRCIKEIREQHEEGRDSEMAARSKIVAGDKTNGRLTSTTDQHRFEGTCVIGGKKHSKTFVTVNAKKATEMWEKWCQDLRDEQEFMDRIERKEPEPEPELDGQEPEPEATGTTLDDPIEEIVPIESAPMPIIEVRPWKDVAEERRLRIEELEARIAELEEKENRVGEAGRDVLVDKPVYILWAKTDNPKLYGAYLTMEYALKELDRLNDVAAFLGNESAFEVEEVAWR